MQLQAWLARLLASPAATNTARNSKRDVARGRTLSGENDRKAAVEVAIE